MISQDPSSTKTGVLLSGGLDSSILAAHLVDRGFVVYPFYIRCNLVWEPFELASAARFLEAIRSPRLRELVVLEMPVDDLYRDHWSVTGRNTPAANSADEAVYLPGRNTLLVVKAAIWCQLHGIQRLALAPLGTSPFADASGEFFASFQAALNKGDGPPLEIECPFAELDKKQVMELGRKHPLEFSFSCISPIDTLHCGRCNKCAERQAAFRKVGLPDPTVYVRQLAETEGSKSETPFRTQNDINRNNSYQTGRQCPVKTDFASRTICPTGGATGKTVRPADQIE